jgi:hypothetical protein
MSLIVVAAILAVGAIVLIQRGDETSTQAITPTATEAIVGAPEGYWNAYTREWVPFEPLYPAGYWNAYTREWVPFDKGASP